MKKKIVIALLATLVILAGAFGYVVYNANSIVGRYKPELEKVASTALGSKVTLGDLSVSLIPTTRVVIDKAVVGANPPTSKGIELKNLDLKVNLNALLSGKLEITELLLDSPELTFIKAPSGVYLEGLPKPGEQPSRAAAPTTPKTETDKGTPAASPSSPLPISLDRFKLSNGAIHFKDTTANKEYAVERISVETAVNVLPDSVKLPVVSFSATALGNVPLGLELKDLSLGLKSGELAIQELVFTLFKNAIKVLPQINLQAMSGITKITTDGIDLASLAPLIKQFAPDADKFGLAGSIKSDIKARFKAGGGTVDYNSAGTVSLVNISANANGFAVKNLVGDLKLAVEPTSKEVSSENIGLDINGQPVSATLKAAFADPQQTATLTSLEAKGFGGTTTVTGSLNLAEAKPYKTNLKVRGLSVASLLSILPGGNTTGFTGNLTAFDADLAGDLGGDVMKAVHGTADVDFKNGVLPGVNIAGKVIRGLSNLPFLSGGGLYEKVGPESKAALDSNDTEVKSLTGNFQIGGGGLQTSNLLMVGPFFSLDANGRVGFDTNVDLNANITFTADFTAGLVRSVKELGGVLDTQGRLVLPLTITGKAPGVLVTPNPNKLIELAAKKAVQKGAEKLLDRALGGKVKGLGGLLKF